MCIVSTYQLPPAEQQGIGFKIAIKEGKIYRNYFNNIFPYDKFTYTKRWKRSPKRLNYNKLNISQTKCVSKRTYKNQDGWHIFLEQKVAKSWIKEIIKHGELTNLVLLKVEYRKGLLGGITSSVFLEDGKCVTARTMRVLEEITI